MNTNAHGTNAQVSDLRALFDEVQVLCGGVEGALATDVETVHDRFSDAELRELLTTILVYLRSAGSPTEETRESIAAQVRSIVDDAVARRNTAESTGESDASINEEVGPASTGNAGGVKPTHLDLFEADGLQVRPVRPAPTFLGKDIELQEGFANTQAVLFWEENLRLKLDLANFRRRENRDPDPDELRQLLWPKGSLSKDDIYKIIPLADDIAARGVRTPPVIDWWGTAWDGNRRLAACRYILASSEYTEAEKERARKIRVWQTDEHATKDQIEAIVTSLNFGEDFKLQWDEYIRGRLVYDAVIERRDSEASRRVLTDRDETKIRQAVGRQFGIKTNDVTRYCKMVVWALDFEDYHREQDRDEVEISNRTNALFQYFYELDSGRGEDKLANKLRDDGGFRAIVFDLMFDGKFKNWAQIRDLRRVYDSPEALDELKQAHSAPSTAVGREHVNSAIDLARQRSVALRQAGRGDELVRITKWLNEDATLSVLRKLDLGVLREFRDAARAVDGMITTLVDGAAVKSEAS